MALCYLQSCVMVAPGDIQVGVVADTCLGLLAAAPVSLVLDVEWHPGSMLSPPTG